MIPAFYRYVIAPTAFLAIIGTASHAATYVGDAAGGACDPANVSSSIDCELWSGNDAHLTTADVLFDMDGWMEAGKYDVGDGYTLSGGFTFDVDEADGKNGTYTFSFDDSYNIGKVFISVKGGPQFATYLLSDGITAGTYSTADLRNGGGKVPDLSHIGVWYTEGVAPVPLPAGLPLALLGLTALGIAGRARKHS